MSNSELYLTLSGACAALQLSAEELSAEAVPQERIETVHAPLILCVLSTLCDLRDRTGNEV